MQRERGLISRFYSDLQEVWLVQKDLKLSKHLHLLTL